MVTCLNCVCYISYNMRVQRSEAGLCSADPLSMHSELNERKFLLTNTIRKRSIILMRTIIFEDNVIIKLLKYLVN